MQEQLVPFVIGRKESARGSEERGFTIQEENSECLITRRLPLMFLTFSAWNSAFVYLLALF